MKNLSSFDLLCSLAFTFLMLLNFFIVTCGRLFFIVSYERYAASTLQEVDLHSLAGLKANYLFYRQSFLEIWNLD